MAPVGFGLLAGVAAVLSALLLLVPPTVGAQERCDYPTERTCLDRLAQRYAPILVFAPGERYFPTIPMFNAFAQPTAASGGVNRLRVPRFVAPLTTRPQLAAPYGLVREPFFSRPGLVRRRAAAIDWDVAAAQYQVEMVAVGRPLEFGGRVPEGAAVFFHTRCLDDHENNRVLRFLRNDPQAWQRLGLEKFYKPRDSAGRRTLGLKEAQFRSLEYYFFYIRDEGLQGHPFDREKIFVFLPMKRCADKGPLPSVSEIADTTDPLLDQVKIVVGAGHSTTTPNNVLVLVGDAAVGYKNPSILVELGGHSSAPDVPPYRHFSVGLDVNWNVSDNIWGTRDLQATSGMGFLGDYDDQFTLPRDPAATVTLAPDILRPAGAVGERQTPATSGVLQDTKIPANSGYYRLLPIAPFELLAKLTSAKAGRPLDLTPTRRDSITALVDSIAVLLGPAWNQTGFRDFERVRDSAAVTEAIRSLHYWTRPLFAADGRMIPASEGQVWLADAYVGRPHWILKRHLYRPSLGGIRGFGEALGLLTLNAGFYLGPGGQQLQVGVILPPGWLREVPVIGKALPPASVAGLLEVQLGWYRRRLDDSRGTDRMSFTLLYEKYYKRTLSWYMKPLNYVPHRDLVENDSTVGDVAVGFGISVMPLFFVPQVANRFGQYFRVRVGPRVDIREWEPAFKRIELQATFYLR